MFDTRKRFLRIGKTVVNLDTVCMFEYRKNEKLLRIHFIGGNTVTIGTMEPERFEKVAAILKYGKVK